MLGKFVDPRLGFRVLPRGTALPVDLKRFQRFTAANVSDAMGKVLTMCSHIVPIVPLKAPLVGTAVTVNERAGDNLMIYKAMSIAQPGDVIVIACQGDSNNALLGGVMSEMASALGIAGFVTDGVVRDTSRLAELGIPVFAQGVTPLAPCWGVPPGQVNCPISCGGIVVEPGDIVFGDVDGVVVVPQVDAERVLQLAAQVVEKEKGYLDSFKNGTGSLIDLAEKELRERGL